MSTGYRNDEPSRADVDAHRGPMVLEFGQDWCGHCQAAQPAIDHALPPRPDMTHLKIADGPGRPLGRSFRVKLWPTLVFLRDGVETARVVRPLAAEPLVQALATLDPTAPG